MSNQRVGPESARSAVVADQAVLVCAYDDEDKCRSMRLAGALTFGEFRDRQGDIPDDREIIFYCA